jgi:hypothetical protein
MGQLPIELKRLRERYEQLVADAASGAIGRDDAYRLLAQLTVIDGHGAQWGLDDEGGFTRRQNPSEQPAAANPGAFVAAGVDPPTRRPDKVFQRRDATPKPLPDAQPQPAPLKLIKEEPDFTRHTHSERVSKFSRVRSLLAAQPSTAIVAGLVVTSLLLSGVTRGSRSTGAKAVVTTTTVSSASVAPGMPVPDDVNRVVSALGSDPLTAASVISGAPQDPVQVAQWKGLLASGMTITVISSAGGEQGAPVTQQWAAVDAAGQQQAVFDVEWMTEAGVWKLQGWPLRR